MTDAEMSLDCTDRFGFCVSMHHVTLKEKVFNYCVTLDPRVRTTQTILVGVNFDSNFEINRPQMKTSMVLNQDP